MNIRHILIFLASLLDEAIAVALILWGLPRLGVKVPLPLLLVLSVVLSIYAVVSYRLILRALERKPVISLVGSRGKVVSRLAPEGTIRVKGELWRAVSTDGVIENEEEVTVVAQDGLTLTVRQNRRDKGRK